jgi:type II secretory pathway component PulJ
VTLIEVLISTALFAFVTAGTYSLYTTMQGALNKGEMKTDLQQNARVGLSRMTQEIRMLGHDPENRLSTLISTSPPFREIRAAGLNCLSFVTYQNDDAGTARTIQVTYDLNSTVLRRRQDPWVPDINNPSVGTFMNGSAQPLAELVDMLTFTYYDRFNGILSPVTGLTAKCPAAPASSNQPASQLSNAQMRYIRRIAVTLRTRDSRPGVFSEFYTVTADVYLRNR